jgi:HEAT repeat protein
VSVLPDHGDAAALLAQATHRDKNVRTAVAFALGKLGSDTEARTIICDAFTDREWRIRFAAVRAVGMWSPKGRTGESLKAVLRDPIASVRWAAVHATVNDEAAQHVAPLAFDDPAPTVRVAAVQKFWRIEGEDSVSLGVQRLEDADERVRFAAAVLLRDRGDPSARDALVAALGDRFVWIRAQAIQGLTRIGGPEVVEPIIARLHDRKRWIRWEASRALGALGAPRAVEPLLMLLARSTSAFGKGSAVVGLGHLGDERAVMPVAEALHEFWTDNPGLWARDDLEACRQFELRRDATKALLRIGGPAAEEQLGRLPSEWVAWVRDANLF